MPSSTQLAGIEGFAVEGFGPVADAFAANFTEGLEVGAACCVYVDGRPVVDLWAGLADPATGMPWREDTPTVIFSISKALLAVLAHQQVEDGRLDLDRPIAEYWPEFAQAGKSAIPVRWVLNHRAGLMAVDRNLSLDEVLAWTPVIKAIEVQAPLWEPGSTWQYHPLTFGWLIGEVLRRITGRTPGDLLRSRVVDPLHLDLWLGLPEAEEPRVANRVRAVDEATEEPDSVVERARTMGSAFAGSLAAVFNDRRIHSAEVPAAGAIGTAQALAKMMAATVAEVAGIRLLRPDTVAGLIRPESESPSWLGTESVQERFSAGFMLDSDACRLLGPASFGHDGAGGELAFADIEHRVGFGYVASQMGDADDPRAHRLVTALRSCLVAGQPRTAARRRPGQ